MVKPLHQVLTEMSTCVSCYVFGAWNEIIDKKMPDANIVMDWGKEKHDDVDRYFIEFSMKQSDQVYRIRERSLGFRWFFVYFLLTQFRQYRKKVPEKSGFLFDLNLPPIFIRLLRHNC